MADAWGRIQCCVGRFTANSTENEAVECSSETFTIGRSKDCSLRITWSKCVSSRHCVLTRKSSSGRVEVKDVSTNGTLLNGTKLVKNNPVQIDSGDTVALVQKREDPSQNLSFQFFLLNNDDSDATQDFAIESCNSPVAVDAAASSEPLVVTGQKRKAGDDSEQDGGVAKRAFTGGHMADSVHSNSSAGSGALNTAPVDTSNPPTTASSTAKSSSPAGDNASSSATAAADAMLENMMCGICQDVLHDCVSLQPCLHAFCGGCYSPWMQRAKNCPQCRQRVVAVRKNNIVNNLVQLFLQQNPSRRRDAAELAELDKANTIKDETVQVSEARNKRDRHDDDDGDDYGEDSDDEYDYDGYSDDYGYSDYEDDDDPMNQLPPAARATAALENLFNRANPVGNPFGRAAAVLPHSVCRQCPGYIGPFRMPVTNALAAVTAPTSTGTAASSVSGTTTTAATTAGAAASGAEDADSRKASASSTPTTANPAVGSTAAAAVGATAAAAVGSASNDGPGTSLPGIVTSFQCSTYTRHLLCQCCFQSMPDRRNERSAEPIPPQECALCKQFYCHQYWTCKRVGCAGCLNQFQQMKFPDNVLSQLVNKNAVESKVLTDHLKAEGKTTSNLLQECVKKLGDGVYSTQDSQTGRLTAEAVLCFRCAVRNLGELAFQYRRDIPAASLPEATRRRPDCHWGRECRTQWNKPHHAERFNHVCLRTRFD
ncbi:E3 ubiquitin-protein ligase CHFR-like [Sycon ciliatum]|uniref:E3 ubiquitin-protein ligase CHFR-like n=1 Tax=Sycon ciliatum TaxID=27933 RepID=UPI0020ADE396|eukprot:scpid35497/ scgid21961/ E3 ubiquitin-protein ligase CHFR; Checkpoint with forkhead and RING finger domains protein; RING finger protein 196